MRLGFVGAFLLAAASALCPPVIVSAQSASASDLTSYEPQGLAEYCDVMIFFGPNEGGASSMAPGGRSAILYDPDVMQSLPYIDAFVFAHECGHHALNHTSMLGLLREGHLFAQKELAADCWAAKTLVQAGQEGELRKQLNIFKDLGSERPSPRHPTYFERATHIESCAYGDGVVNEEQY